MRRSASIALILIAVSGVLVAALWLYPASKYVPSKPAEVLSTEEQGLSPEAQRTLRDLRETRPGLSPAAEQQILQDLRK